jgi:hypothetical protein
MPNKLKPSDVIWDQGIPAGIEWDDPRTVLPNPKAINYNDPTAGMSTGEKALAGSGKYFSEVTRGVAQLPIEVAANTPGDPLGMVPRRDRMRQEEAETRRLDAPLMATGAGKAGYLGTAVGTGLAIGAAGGPARAIAAPRTFGEALLSGSVHGNIMPATSGQDRATNVALSMGGAAVGQQGVRAGSHLLQPVTPSKEARKLLGEGVVPTPGQAVDPRTLGGRTVRNLEERVASAPLIGEPIHAARERAFEELNAAALRRAGYKGNKIGLEGIKEASDQLGHKFDSVIAKIPATRPDQQLILDLSTAGDGLLMEPAHQQMLVRQLSMIGQNAQNGQFTGEGLQKVRSQWRAQARAYASSENPSHRELGKALNNAADGLDDFVERNIPQDLADEYSTIRRQYASLVRVESAGAKAANRANEPGVFTPNQYMQGVTQNAGGLKRKTVSHGEALDQDLATAGMALRNTRPDSGTTERLLTAALLGGGLGAAGVVNLPAAATAAAGTWGAYGLRPVTKYMVGGYGFQGPWAEAMRNHLGPTGALLGSQLPELLK